MIVHVIMIFCFAVCFSFAPWCPACQHVAPTWSAFALKGKQLGINVAKVDVTTQSGI